MVRFILFFGLISILVCGLNYRILKKRLKLGKVGNRRLFIFHLISGILIVVGPYYFRFHHGSILNPFQQALQAVQYFVMGWIGVSLIFMVAAEFVQLFTKRFDPSKRIFLTDGVTRGIVAGSTVVAVGGLAQAEFGPKITPVTIHLPTLPKAFDGLTLAQISDVHIGPLLHKRFLNHVVDQVLSLNADLICITGDLVDGTVEQIGHLVEPLKRLKAKEGVYFCTGNHEYYSGVEEWIAHLESIGVHVFKNTNHILTRGENKLLIAGVHDWKSGEYSSHHETDPESAAQTSENVSCKILLAHNPFSIDGAAKAGFNLQISGHTHAGQFYPFAFIVKAILKHSEGWYQVTPKTQLYVNRGTGYWGPPNRFGKWSEVTHFTLKSSS